MKRLTAQGGWVNLEEGGTVASSYINRLINDYLITVTYSPKLTRYLELSLTESGKDVLTYLPSGTLPQDKMIFYPDLEGCPTMLTFKVNHPAPEVDFGFILFGSPDALASSTAHTKNDYLYFKCSPDPDNNKRCTSNLEWKDAKGNVNHSWSAISGPYGNGKLPAGEYKVPISGYGTFKKEKYPDLKGMCDSQNNCWYFNLDPQFSTSRKGLAIHPDGGKEGTKGCIGISKDIKNTLTIRNKLRDYLLKHKDIKLEVTE